MPVVVIAGDVGSGKTYLSMRHPFASRGLFFDVEDRYATTLRYNKLIPVENCIQCLQYDSNYDIDAAKTFDYIKEQVRKYLQGSEYPLVVLDGVSDLRRMAVEKWLQLNPNRKRPQNAGDWSEINDMVKEVVFRLFNYARVTKRYVVLTAWTVDEYDEKGVKTGKKTLDCKEFILARADEIILTKRVGTQYYARRAKSPRGASEWVDITEGGENGKQQEEKETDQRADQ